MCLKVINTIQDLTTLKVQVNSTKMYFRVYGALLPAQVRCLEHRTY